VNYEDLSVTTERESAAIGSGATDVRFGSSVPARMNPTGRGAHPWHQISFHSCIIVTRFQPQAGLRKLIIRSVNNCWVYYLSGLCFDETPGPSSILLL